LLHCARQASLKEAHLATVSESEVLAYFDTLSNWGRWGAEDELGTVNHITAAKRLAAARTVSEGRSVSCSRLVSKAPMPGSFIAPVHFMVESGEGWNDPNKQSVVAGLQYAMDYIGLVFHGNTITHLDSLSHVFWDNQMYNARPAALVSTNRGATKESIDLLRNGIVSRGVLLDVAALKGKPWLDPGEAVMPEDLEACEQRSGLRVEPGDVLLVRTGHSAALAAGKFSDDGRTPGLHASCLPFLHERGVAVLVGDAANDVFPSGYEQIMIPIHQVGLVALGLWLLDNADLEELSAVCQELGRWQFLFTLAPLRLEGATGSPLNPIALF
jgi:kynurenine formamidase